MSRSYREPYYTDTGWHGKRRKYFKKLANRVARRHWWNITGIYKRLMLTYDISDYSFYCPKDEKAYRK